MEMSFIASFWLVSFLLIITPGADWAYTISAGINGRRVIPAVAGLMSGHLLATLIVIAGIGVLIANHPLALSTLTLLGAGYLLWLGIGILRHPSAPSAAEGRTDSWQGWAIKGLCISGLNPKVFLLFLALLPQFTDPQGSWSVTQQMLILSSLHLLTCTLVYLVVGYCSRAILTTRPHVAYLISMLSGSIMILTASILIYGELT